MHKHFLTASLSNQKRDKETTKCEEPNMTT